jgi:rubrerythrin
VGDVLTIELVIILEEKIVPEITLEEVLDQAILREVGAFAFYKRLIDSVADTVSKDTLAFIAKEELKHKEILERYARGELGQEALSLREVVDARVVEALGPPDVTERLDQKDIFLVAAEREKASHEFYTKLAELQPAGELKKLLYKLAQEELAHKEKAENLYCNAAFPQTDGG